ncbi:MAG: spermidine synthase [Actinomycetia bacterium]|nr:spermidine synthase [Actinomycetes bacterium]
MAARFAELDYEDTGMGELTLRRRFDPQLQMEVYEVKLGDEFLMSSLFTVAEEQLSELALAQIRADKINVLVGGLGLGYTALAALRDDRVQTLCVVEALGPVIRWHEQELLPDTAGLAADPRVRLLQGSFFNAVEAKADAEARPTYDAILLDIDHSPAHVLHASHASFYTAAGLSGLKGHLNPEGVFGLWSDDPPDSEFLALLDAHFSEARAEVVSFPNPLTGGVSSNTVYLAQLAEVASQ